MNHLTKTSLLLAVFQLVFFARSFGQDSVSISDFRYPETKAIDLKGGLSGRLSKNQSDRNTVPGGYYDSHDSDSRFFLGGLSMDSKFLFFHVNENHNQSFELTASIDYQNTTETENRSYPPLAPYSTEHKRDNKSALIAGVWNYQHYFNQDDLHFLGQGMIRNVADYRKENNLSSQAGLNPPGANEIVTKTNGLRLDAFVGLGIGRMRDGSFVFRVLRIIDRMKEDGMISVELTRAQVLEVVDRVAHVREYLTNYERAEKYLVGDVAKELARVGAIDPQAITPYSALRIAEAFRETIEPRLFGWRAYYAFGGFHTQSLYDQTDSRYPSQDRHSFIKDGVMRVFTHRFGGEFGHPVSLSTHLHSDLTVDIPTRETTRFFSIKFNSTLSYQLGERVDITTGYTFSRSVGTDSYSGNGNYYSTSVAHDVSANLNFFLEDQVSLNANVSYRRHAYEMYPAPLTPYYSRESSSSSGLSISFGVNYNII